MNKEFEEFYSKNKTKPLEKLEKLQIYQEICKITSFLDKTVPFSQRIWHIKNNNFNIQHCKNCHSETIFLTKEKNYQKFCCRKCYNDYNKTNERKEEIKNNNIDFNDVKITYSLNDLLFYYLSNKSKLQLSLVNDEEYKQIRKMTLFLNLFYNENDITLSQRIWHIKNNNFDIQKCTVCGGSAVYDRRIKGYKKTCSNKCTEMYMKSSERIDNNCLDRINSDFLNVLEKYGFKERFTYIKYSGNRNYEVKCNTCNHSFVINYNFFYKRVIANYDPCPFCNPITEYVSNGESQIVDFIKENYEGEIITNSRKIIHPHELDIYIPEKELAIEYNGLYWHSEAHKDKNYHMMKSNKCKELGIHLIHIFEDDWLYKNEICKSVIKNFLGIGSQNIVYARKCELRDVNFKDTNAFLENNHMLGKIANISHSVGLYYNNELISLMAFQCISKESNVVELSRYAIKIDHNIKGGAERIFKEFLRKYSHKYTKIRTFNDNGVFKGTVHYRLGFVHTGNNPPNYMYFDMKLNKRVSKQSLRKVRLSYKQGEQQFIDDNRYFRVYNAGNDTCEFIINKQPE